MSRPYDPQIDNHYDPEENNGCYLTPEQVAKYLAAIPDIGLPPERAVREFLQKYEEAIRRLRTLRITEDKATSVCRQLTIQFREDFEIWPYQTKTHKEFYRLLGNDLE